MFGRISSFISQSILVLLLAGCQPSFPKVESSYSSAYQPKPFLAESITADGSAIITDDLQQINLSTGEEHRVYKDFVPDEWLEHYSIQRIDLLQPEDVVVVETIDSQSKYYIGLPVFKLDINNKSISEPLNIKNIHDPSPYGKRIIANSTDRDNGSWQVFDLTTNTIISITNANIRYENIPVKASEEYLWSIKINLPVAHLLRTDPINLGGENRSQIVGIYPVIGDADGDLAEFYSEFNSIYQSDPPDNMIDAQFSPDGNFILVTKWICDPSDPKQCSRYDLGSDDQRYDGSVTDTALILINWRTGETKELIRLSQVDTSNVIGMSTEWSADGSTILVWRKEASPVVIKLK
jgi:hypothetical protein